MSYVLALVNVIVVALASAGLRAGPTTSSASTPREPELAAGMDACTGLAAAIWLVSVTAIVRLRGAPRTGCTMKLSPFAGGVPVSVIARPSWLKLGVADVQD